MIDPVVETIPEGGAANPILTASPAIPDANAADWRSALPEELRNDPTLQNFSSVDTLAKSYVNARKMIGKDTLAVPETDDQWSETYNKLGRPGSGAEYNLTTPDTLPENAARSAEADAALRTEMHKLGLNQKQAAGLSDYLYNIVQTAGQSSIEEQDQAQAAAITDLRKEFGSAYDVQLKRSLRAAEEVGGPEILKLLEDNPALGNSAAVVKMFAKIADLTLGDTGLAGDGNGITPTDLKTQIAELMAKPGYTDRTNPEHDLLVKKVMGLREQLHTPVQ